MGSPGISPGQLDPAVVLEAPHIDPQARGVKSSRFAALRTKRVSHCVWFQNAPAVMVVARASSDHPCRKWCTTRRDFSRLRIDALGLRKRVRSGVSGPFCPWEKARMRAERLARASL